MGMAVQRDDQLGAGNADVLPRIPVEDGIRHGQPFTVFFDWAGQTVTRFARVFAKLMGHVGMGDENQAVDHAHRDRWRLLVRGNGIAQPFACRSLGCQPLVRIVQQPAFDDGRRLAVADQFRRGQPEHVQRSVHAGRGHAPVAVGPAPFAVQPRYRKPPINQDVGQGVRVSRDAGYPVLRQQFGDFLRPGLPHHMQAVLEVPDP